MLVEAPSARRPRCSCRGRRRAALALVLTAAIFAVGAASASAVIVRVGARSLSYQPVPGAGAQLQPSRMQALPGLAPLMRSGPPLEYHGGPVMPANADYAFYWDPAGAPVYPAGYQAGLDRYFEDLAHDSGGVQNTDSVLTQYGDEAGEFANYDSLFAGALIDTDPYPPNGCSAAPICLTDEQLQTELTRYVTEHALPANLTHEYFMLTPPGVESCFEAKGHSCSPGTSRPSYCAYHADIAVTGGVIIYANDPFISAESGCDPGEEHPNDLPSDATIGGGLAHEHSESVTDPELDAWYDQRGNEVADKCATYQEASEFGEPLGRAPDGAKYNQVINGDLYWYQQEWSNLAGGCVQRSPSAPVVSKLKHRRGPAAGGTSVTLTGTGFIGASEVEFGSHEAAGFEVASANSITAISPPGTGTVDIRVITPGGKSAINGSDRFTYRR